MPSWYSCRAVVWLACAAAAEAAPGLQTVARLPVTPGGEQALRFVDRETGFILVQGSIWKTENAGSSWSPVTPPPGSHADLRYSAQFCGGGLGWVMPEGALYLTDSYGKDWSERPKPLTYPRGVIETIFLLCQWRTGWAGGGEYGPEPRGAQTPRWAIDPRPEGVFVARPVLFRTPDAGSTWTRVRLPSGLGYRVNHVRFVDTNTGVATIGSSILATHDGGQTWRAVVSGNPRNPARVAEDVFLLDQRRAWVSFDDGSLFRTTDGGRHWRSVLSSGGMISPEPTSETMYPLQMWFWSGEDGLALNSIWMHLYVTHDGGRTWKVLFPDVKIRAYSAVDLHHVWAAAGDSLFRVVGLR